MTLNLSLFLCGEIDLCYVQQEQQTFLPACFFDLDVLVYGSIFNFMWFDFQCFFLGHQSLCSVCYFLLFIFKYLIIEILFWCKESDKWLDIVFSSYRINSVFSWWYCNHVHSYIYCFSLFHNVLVLKEPKILNHSLKFSWLFLSIYLFR